ncbi:hypothetical protein D3C80_1476420 [compost metagenome]
MPVRINANSMTVPPPFSMTSIHRGRDDPRSSCSSMTMPLINTMTAEGWESLLNTCMDRVIIERGSPLPSRFFRMTSITIMASIEPTHSIRPVKCKNNRIPYMKNTTPCYFLCEPSGPSMVIMAGSSMPRTRKVSMRIPIVIMIPNRNSSCSGCEISTPNVAARIMPADDMTPPVRATPRLIASCHSKFLASSLIRETSIML